MILAKCSQEQCILDFIAVSIGSHRKVKLGIYYIYIYIYIYIYMSRVSKCVYHVCVRSGVLCYSVGRAPQLSTSCGGKEAKPDFSVLVFSGLPSDHSVTTEHYRRSDTVLTSIKLKLQLTFRIPLHLSSGRPLKELFSHLYA